jgi:hypothetical protein
MRYTPPSPVLQNKTNLIKNPFFNNSASTICKAVYCYSSNNEGIAPWYLTVGSVYELNQFSWPNYNGSQFSMDLSADMPYAIGQLINTVPGFPYMVTYIIRINAADASTPVKRGFIRATGAAESLFTHSTTTWTAKYYNFVATSPTTLLEIGSTTGSIAGPVLGRMWKKEDKISIIINAFLIDVSMLPGVAYTGCFQADVTTSSLSPQNGSSFNMTSCVVACLADSPMNYWFGLQNGSDDFVIIINSILNIKCFPNI